MPKKTSAPEPPPSDPRVTAGGRQLEAYIRKNYASIPKFVDAHPTLDRVQVQRAINGDRWKRVPVDFALAIERATDGAVPVAAWASATAKPRAQAA